MEQYKLNFIEKGRLSNEQMSRFFGGGTCQNYSMCNAGDGKSNHCGIYEVCASDTDKKNICVKSTGGLYYFVMSPIITPIATNRIPTALTTSSDKAL